MGKFAEKNKDDKTVKKVQSEEKENRYEFGL